MSSEIKANSIQDKTGTRVLASDSGSAWSWGSGVPKGSVIEQFVSPCNGSSITVQSGTYTVQNVPNTGVQALTSSWEDLSGSVITYTPPTGTQTVVFEFNYFLARSDATFISLVASEDLSSMTGTPKVGVWVKWMGGAAIDLRND